MINAIDDNKGHPGDGNAGALEEQDAVDRDDRGEPLPKEPQRALPESHHPVVEHAVVFPYPFPHPLLQPSTSVVASAPASTFSSRRSSRTMSTRPSVIPVNTPDRQVTPLQEIPEESAGHPGVKMVSFDPVLNSSRNFLKDMEMVMVDYDMEELIKTSRQFLQM